MATGFFGPQGLGYSVSDYMDRDLSAQRLREILAYLDGLTRPAAPPIPLPQGAGGLGGSPGSPDSGIGLGGDTASGLGLTSGSSPASDTSGAALGIGFNQGNIGQQSVAQAALSAALAQATTFGVGPLSLGPFAGTPTANSQAAGTVGQIAGLATGTMGLGTLAAGFMGGIDTATQNNALALNPTAFNQGVVNSAQASIGLASPAVSAADLGIMSSLSPQQALDAALANAVTIEPEPNISTAAPGLGLSPSAAAAAAGVAGTAGHAGDTGNAPGTPAQGDPGSPAAGLGSAGPGGGDGGGDGSHICGALYRRGLLGREDLAANARFRRTRMSEAEYRGYSRWALPLVRVTDRHPRLGRVLVATLGPVALCYMREIRQPGSSRLGRLILRLGLRVCARLGRASGPSSGPVSGSSARPHRPGRVGIPGGALVA